VNFATYASRNLLRRKGRTILTILGVAIAVIVFVLLRTVLWSWNQGVENAAKDRLGTRHKVSFILPLPKRYVDDIRKVSGVKQVSWANWFGGQDPKDKSNFFGTFAVDHTTWFEVYDEMHIDEATKKAWMEDRQAAILGDALAKKLNVKPGDKFTLKGTIFPGDWTFNVVGIYTATRKSVDRSSFLFRWDMLNDDPRFARNKDNVGWVVSRIDNPAKSAEISRTIDKMFDDRDVQTLSMSEKALQMSFMAMFSAILAALNGGSIIILIIMMLILANTIAMGVRERTHEYGVLRAIGFQPKHVFRFIMVEGMLIGLLGGLVGLALTALILMAIGPAIEENMGAWLPYFRLDPLVALVAMALAISGASLAAFIPGFRASRLTVVSALRRID
jgi:putative ABC transport system permease protein